MRWELGISLIRVSLDRCQTGCSRGGLRGTIATCGRDRALPPRWRCRCAGSTARYRDHYHLNLRRVGIHRAARGVDAEPDHPPRMMLPAVMPSMLEPMTPAPS